MCVKFEKFYESRFNANRIRSVFDWADCCVHKQNVNSAIDTLRLTHLNAETEKMDQTGVVLPLAGRPQTQRTSRKIRPETKINIKIVRKKAASREIMDHRENNNRAILAAQRHDNQFQ